MTLTGVPSPAAPTAPPGADSADIAGAARGGLVNLFGAAVAGLAGFGVTCLVARALGPTQAGAFFAATAAFVLAGTLAKLGTQTGLVYFTARLRAAGTPGELRRCLRVALAPVLAATALTAIGLWFGAPLLARFTAGDSALGYIGQLRVLAVFLPLAVLSDTLLAATRGWRVMRPTVLLDKLIRPLAQLIVLAGLALLAVRAPAAYTMAWVGPYLPTAVLAGCALARLLPRRPAGSTPTGGLSTRAPSPSGRAFSGRVFWRFTGPRAVASLAQLALQRVDVLLLAAMAGLPAAACYAVAGRFLVLGQFANQAISLSVQPRLAELLCAGDRAGANTLYRTATGWLVLTAWPLYLSTAVFSSVYLGLFGPGYRSATGVVLVLSLGMLVATGCGMVDMVLSMAGRTSWNLANVLTALGVQLAMDLLLIPRLGALGAAIGLSTAIVTNNLVPLAQVGFALRLHPFGRSTLLAAGLAVGCFGLLPLGLVAAFGRRPGTALLAIALGGAGYLAAVLALRGPLRLDSLRLTSPRGPRRARAGRTAPAGGHTATPGARASWENVSESTEKASHTKGT